MKNYLKKLFDDVPFEDLERLLNDEHAFKYSWGHNVSNIQQVLKDAIKDAMKDKNVSHKEIKESDEEFDNNIEFVDNRKNAIVHGTDDPGFDEYDKVETTISDTDIENDVDDISDFDSDNIEFVDNRKDAVLHGTDDHGFDEYDIKR